jgi:hypothetical protein
MCICLGMMPSLARPTSKLLIVSGFARSEFLLEVTAAKVQACFRRRWITAKAGACKGPSVGQAIGPAS